MDLEKKSSLLSKIFSGVVNFVTDFREAVAKSYIMEPPPEHLTEERKSRWSFDQAMIMNKMGNGP